MLITCKSINLSKGLNTVSHVANKNASLPILGNVLLNINEGGLTLTTTNLELAVWVSVRGKVEEVGSVTVNARLLTDYLNLIPQDEVVTIKTSNNQVILEVGSITASLQSLPTTDFPVIPSIKGGVKIHLEAATFRDCLTRVIFAVSTDEARPEINGVFFHAMGDEVVLASTDSYRLAESRLKPLHGVESEVKQIIPWRAVQELLRILGGAPEGEVVVTIGEGQLLFTVDDTSLISRTVEGQYPDYQPIIPTAAQTTITIPVAEFSRAIKQASLFCKPGVNDVQVTAEEGAVTISAANSAVGEHTARLETTVAGAAGRAVFNYRFILDGLAAIGTKEVELQLTGEATPALLKPHQQADYLYVIMPIRQ